MPFEGEGLRKTLIISQHEWQNSHWMLDRLINRGGNLDKSHFKFASLDTPKLVETLKAEDIKAVVGLGEPVLRTLLGEKDILRWRGRVVDWMGVKLIPTFAPHKLLPENPNAAMIAKMKAQGITLLTNPPRFQGTWIRDVEFALAVAKHGYERKKADYLIDPQP